jgi:hypothetical protein
VSLVSKLKVFFENNDGIKKQWFAKRLGMPKQQFYQVANGLTPCPKKYWVKLIELTGGQIQLGDLVEQMFEGIDFIEIKCGKNPDTFEGSLKEINKEK